MEVPLGWQVVQCSLEWHGGHKDHMRWVEEGKLTCVVQEYDGGGEEASGE
jgi:hypothetical protein